jgi:hypothetical protein
MNTSLLAREASDTIISIESGSINKANLRHILDELCENLDRDQVAQSLISVDLAGIKSVLMNPKSTEHSISTTIDLLSHQLPIGIYKKRNEQMLQEEICGEQNPSNIRALTRSYITTLLNSGYSHTFLKNYSQHFFFYSKDRISGNSAITEYFKPFSNKPSEFSVIYKAPQFLLDFQKPGKILGLTVSKTLPEFDSQLSRSHFGVSRNEVYLLVPKRKSKDPFSAKAHADNIVDQFQTLIGLYHHKEAPKPILEGMVFCHQSSTSTKVSASVNPMHKCHDLKPGVASKKLAKFMQGFSMQRESFRKFNRSAELHALALSSESKENQMINLWISLESLIPNKDEQDKIAQIEHITKSVIPFLNLGYINKLTTNLSKDLLRWNSKKVKKILHKAKGGGVMEKLTNLMALEKYERHLTSLLTAVEDFPLLHERTKYIHHVLSSPQSVTKTLDAHKQRLEWQIRRIYRARNMIVHDGSTPSYTEVLIENTHHYLDTIMSGIMSLASEDNTLNTIDQSFKMVEINYNSFYKKLQAKGLQFTEDNIDNLLHKYPL